VNFKPVFRVIAALLGVMALLMGLCGGVSYWQGEAAVTWRALLHSAGGTLVVAGILWALTRNRQELSRRDGLGVVTFGWLLAGLAGAAPYWLSGVIASPMAAIFESVSGLTTTGATVIPVLEGVPRGILLWRALTQFIGGMGVLVLVMAVLPFSGAGGMQLFRAEMPGPTKDRIEPRMASTAKMLWGVYLILAAVLLVLLRAGGMTWCDAICHSLTTVATGGFSTRTASIAAFDSVYIETVLTFFMLLCGVNFAVHYRALRGDVAAWWRDAEARFFLGIFAVAAVAATFGLHHARAGLAWSSAAREAAFTCASLITSTGFSTGNFDLWPALLKWMLALLMLMGGCAESTAGGIKAGRIQVLLKTVIREVRLFMQPQAVIPVKIGRKVLNDELLRSILAFVLLFFLILVGGIAALLPFMPDIQTAASSAIASLSNVGPGFAGVGPASSYAAIPAGGQGILAVLMLVGRLELFTVLAILMPSFWRK